MVKIIRRFFAFCGEENRHKFRSSIWLGVLQALFEAMKIPAIACMVRALLRGSVTTRDILLSLGIMLLSILGSGLRRATTPAPRSVWRLPSTCAISPWATSTKTLSARLLPLPPT